MTDNVYPFRLRQPDAFVRLGVDDDSAVVTEQNDDGSFRVSQVNPHDLPDQLRLERNSFAIRISREAAIGYGLVEPTDEERAQLAADAARFRARETAARAEPGPPLTLEGLLERLDWLPSYAVHYMHPACSCEPFRDDPYLCSWALELGFTRVGAR